MTGLTFAQPFWLWGILVLILPILLRVRSHFYAAKQLPGLVSPKLLPQLVSGGSGKRRWVTFSLQCLALSAAFIALARPQAGFVEIETQSESRNLLIAVDTSRSMLAEDLKPNRLSRAKLAAVEILNSLPDDRVGIIAFAGKPFVQAPLTVDHEAVLESLRQLDTEVIPRGGTNLASAAELALETFEEAKVEQGAVVLFSDGEALEGTEKIESVRARAKRNNIVLLTIGVGTRDGSIIPELDENGRPLEGVFIKDESGQIVRSRLNPIAMQELSQEGGRYVHLGGSASLTSVVEEIRSSIETSRSNSQTRLRPIERFTWPLSLAVLLLCIAHLVPFFASLGREQSRILPSSRETPPAALALILLFVGLPKSGQGEDPFFRAHEAFLKKDYEGAITTFEGALSEPLPTSDRSRAHLGIGAAAFRQGDYERAAEAYGSALADANKGLREQAHYNLGNTLFRQGESVLGGHSKGSDPDAMQNLSAPGEAVEETLAKWEGALEHYDSALSLNEENQKAAHNRGVVARRIEELKRQQQEQESQSQEGGNNSESRADSRPDSSNPESDPSSSEDESEDSPPESENPEGEGEEGNDEQESSEDPREENQGDSEEESKPESGDSNQPPPTSPPEGQGDQPQDGKLEAQPSQGTSQGGQASNPADQQENPETGYSPSDARQLLESLADETEVRPVMRTQRGESYRNW